MTAPVYSSSLLYTGLRELSQVTNTFAGYIISAGSAYDLTLPWQADKLEWFNYTKYATNSKNLQGVWFRDFPTGDALIVSRGTTDLSSVLEATNGVTLNNTASGFASEHVTITGATTATPCVITAAGHGLADGDRIIITKVIGTIGEEINNIPFVVKYISSSTFSLYDVYGNAITTVGSYTSGGQLNKMGPSLGTVNSQPVYKLTLGTAIMGDASDKLYIVATKFNAYFNFGTL